MNLEWAETVLVLRKLFGSRMVITGAVAMAMYGYERMTGDLDVIILLDKDDPEKVKGSGGVYVKTMYIEDGEVQRYRIGGKVVDIQVLPDYLYGLIRKRSVPLWYSGLNTVRVIHIRDLIEMKWRRNKVKDQGDIGELERIMIRMGLEPPWYVVGKGLLEHITRSLKPLPKGWKVLYG